MSDPKNNEAVFKVICPCCEATVWVDGKTRAVIKSEKAPRKKNSLDDLLLKEKVKADGMGRKLEATFELQKKKHDEAEEKFKHALSHPEEEK
jgi:hypothetical protein